MNIRKIIAIGVIYLIACAGWSVLGTVTALRSNQFSSRLGTQIESLWGRQLVQRTPTFAVQIPGTNRVRRIMPIQNSIQVDLMPDYRKKGLIWYPTYICSFDGRYIVNNTEAVTQKIRFRFNFPAEGVTYEDFAISKNGIFLMVPVNTGQAIGEIVELAPGESVEFRIKYKTRGVYTWRYRMDKNIGRVQNLILLVKTGFHNIDYTEGSLSPMAVNSTDDGTVLRWQAADLITNDDIGIVVPEKINPGPLTSRITYFAPVCLIFFFILIATIHIMYSIDIHPMHYLFVAAGFFAFHLLLSYLVGLVNLHLSFIISAIISVGLVTAYLAAALGKKFPWKVAIAGQFFFLVLFSYSFFIKGITGLTVAIGSVITLAILMKVTAGVNWDKVFTKPGSMATSSGGAEGLSTAVPVPEGPPPL
jgi:hypothetical protein